jgi:hypothetical protein
MTYDVVTSRERRDFVSKVNERLSSGWALSGSMCIGEDGLFCQAVLFVHSDRQVN